LTSRRTGESVELAPAEAIEKIKEIYATHPHPKGA
jgi:prolyl-tRNA synthetase